MSKPSFLVRELGLREYRKTWQAMRDMTDARTEDTPSECWLLEHPPVFTQGQAGKPEHLLDPGPIPVVQTDRGGQVTYHGPGQLILYLLLDLKEAGMGIRQLVSAMENSVIALLDEYQVEAYSAPKAPGVYVGQQKIAALGLRVRRGYTYHGLALNVDMDLEPFSRINPCGYAGQEVTQLKSLGVQLNLEQAGKLLVQKLAEQLGYTPRWNTNDR